MKLILDIKNGKKAIKPTKDDIILYNGKEWYIVTKQELFKEYNERFEEAIAECEAKEQEMDAFKVEIAQQILDLQEIVKAIVLKENK